MSKYQALSTFTSSKGTRYSSGQVIDTIEYYSLGSGEQSKFTQQSTSSYSSPTVWPQDPLGLGDMLGSGLPGGYDFDYSTPI